MLAAGQELLLGRVAALEHGDDFLEHVRELGGPGGGGNAQTLVELVEHETEAPVARRVELDADFLGHLLDAFPEGHNGQQGFACKVGEREQVQRLQCRTRLANGTAQADDGVVVGRARRVERRRLGTPRRLALVGSHGFFDGCHWVPQILLERIVIQPFTVSPLGWYWFAALRLE